ncbi:M28 family metallopeptidase [Aldersonia sp. NBC_00410]|uniref:M28 family metallopeptidase n=1 Tax=Aldersonia sp. NBC_00410 TaxID=2975954 RepID=UPI0022575237|nr:M28 family metallopeptidase [Aldersonia sp. NBC_00410]MCX5042971.1 M28 family metallopeptidase [Aldersonia sp. NBC_00410]
MTDTTTPQLETAAVEHTCRRGQRQRRRYAPERPALVAAERDDATAQLISRLSLDRYVRSLAALTAYPTRHSFGFEFRAAMSAAQNELDGLGYTSRREPFVIGRGACENLIAERAGTGPGERGIVIVTAHLDSVNQGGRELPAPGADDNASGCAGVLELARVLVTEEWRNDLCLILFGGEEQGLYGSLAHVAGLSRTDRGRIAAVLNMDMIARRNGTAPGVMIEGAAVSHRLIDQLVTAAATWTGLEVTTSLNPYASDHVPFIDAGLPAVLTIEANDTANTDVHTDGDAAAKLDPALAMEILAMNLAATAANLTSERPEQ